MITKDKVTEIFCIIDEFDKNLSAEFAKNLRLPSHNSDGKRYRNRKGRLSESEIMTILVCYHFGTYRNFKEYYLNWVKGVMRQDFPDAVSYNRFVELMPRVFFKMMLFMKLYAFGKCTGITFVEHNDTRMSQCTTILQQGLCRPCQGRKGYHGLVPWIQAAPALQ